jgi:predicted dehydrogenase
MSRFSRRSFLKQSAAVGASALAAPAFIANLRAAPPSETVRHAAFGASGMSAADWGHIIGHKNVKLVAVADVDTAKFDTVTKRVSDGSVKLFQDWRKMLDEMGKSIDTVNVSTPDHMHAPQGMSAMQLGLHVYGQKPLAHDIYECRKLAEFAREKKLVTQMGIQVHSSTQYRSAVELVQNGTIGKVTEVHTWSNKQWGDGSPRPDKSDPVPETLDWNGWLGTAAERPFIGGGYYHPGNWRKRLDFGTGTFGDMGCHIYDPVFKALALTAPLSVHSTGPKPTEFNWANDAVVKYVFPGTKFTAGKTVDVTWYDGNAKRPDDVLARLGDQKAPGQGSVFFGTKGTMILPHVSNPIILRDGKVVEVEMPKLEPQDHWFQFIDAARGAAKGTSANFDYAGALTEAVLLGGVAARFPNETLEWDAKSLTFKNQPAANQYVKREYRKGWEVPGLS